MCRTILQKPPRVVQYSILKVIVNPESRRDYTPSAGPDFFTTPRIFHERGIIENAPDATLTPSRVNAPRGLNIGSIFYRISYHWYHFGYFQLRYIFADYLHDYPDGSMTNDQRPYHLENPLYIDAYIYNV